MQVTILLLTNYLTIPARGALCAMLYNVHNISCQISCTKDDLLLCISKHRAWIRIADSRTRCLPAVFFIGIAHAHDHIGSSIAAVPPGA